MTEKADAYLATVGLSRVHHRILYVIARKPDVTVGSLQDILGISKQALHRPLKHLLDQNLVVSKRDADQHRYKILGLTSAGEKIEHRASELERRVMKKAFTDVGTSGASAMDAGDGIDRRQHLTTQFVCAAIRGDVSPSQVNYVDMRGPRCHYLSGHRPGRRTWTEWLRRILPGIGKPAGARSISTPSCLISPMMQKCAARLPSRLLDRRS